MGRLVIGVLIGAGVSAAAVMLLSRRSGKEHRESLQERLKLALAEGKAAAEQQEQQLWTEYRKKLTDPPVKPASSFPSTNYPPYY
ncbi:MAG: hypothetical protein HC911_02235 [Chloroflexaceae bacterium]|nr:hypothetical protein [Chloroflexaceae bacterium]